MLYVHHPSSLRHDPGALSPDHPDSPLRIVAIEEAISKSTLPALTRLAVPRAAELELRLVHSAQHVDTIRGLCESGGGQIDDDTFAGPASYEAALHAAGGACAMVRELVSNGERAGFCALRPAGHHASRTGNGILPVQQHCDRGRARASELGVQRVMIVDWDVHAGNGTAEIFRRRPDVLVADIHQAGLYPGTGAK